MYEALRKALDIDHNHPLGLIMHGVSEVDGTMQVAQIWESSWYAALFDENLAPLLEAVGAPKDVEIRVLSWSTSSRPRHDNGGFRLAR